MLQVTGYSVVCQVFSDEIMKYIGYIEICVGLGLGLGPVLGSVVYAQLGYESTMFFFGVCNGVTTLLCVIMIPNVLNATISDIEVAEMEWEEEMHMDA